MSLGLGQLAGGFLLGSLMGNDGFLSKNKGLLEQDEEQERMKGGWSPPNQQPMQVASNTTQQGGGGFLSGISNSIFQGMTAEQVARLGQGFNTMRLDPDPTMASAFQSTIDTSISNAELAKKKNSTIAWLSNRKSEQYPNGRVDLIKMVEANIISPAEAVNTAMNVAKPSAFAEKMKWLIDNPNATSQQLQLAGITENEANSIEEYEYYKKHTKDVPPVGYMEFLSTKGDKTEVNVNTSGDPEGYTPFWEALDKAYGPEYLAWTEGLSSDTWGNLVKLQEVFDALRSGEQLTGPIVGLMPDFFNAFLNPDVTQAREAVESVVQRNLKAVLGAQFTEKEGERLISRAYNPKLPPEMNAQRLAILIEQMQQAVLAKNSQAEWVRNKGTLMGWDGRLSTWNDFYTAVSIHNVGDVVCTNQTGSDRQCFSYNGGDDKAKTSWDLVK